VEIRLSDHVQDFFLLKGSNLFWRFLHFE